MHHKFSSKEVCIKCGTSKSAALAFGFPCVSSDEDKKPQSNQGLLKKPKFAIHGNDDTRRIKKRWDYPRVSSEAKSSLIVLTAIGFALLGFATLIVFNNYDPSATYQRYHRGTPVSGPISGRVLHSNWLLWAAFLGFCGFALTIGGIKEFLKEWADVRQRRKDILEREKNKESSKMNISQEQAEAALRNLKSNDLGIRFQALKTLVALKDARAIEQLVEWLQDNDYSIRIYAAEAMGNIRDRQALEPLLVALKDRNSDVRAVAVCALENIDVKWTEAEEAKKAIPLCIAALSDEDDYVRRGAAEALIKIGDAQAVDPLVRALKDRDSGVREAAAIALEKFGTPESKQALVGYHQSERSKKSAPSITTKQTIEKMHHKSGPVEKRPSSIVNTDEKAIFELKRKDFNRKFSSIRTHLRKLKIHSLNDDLARRIGHDFCEALKTYCQPMNLDEVMDRLLVYYCRGDHFDDKALSRSNLSYSFITLYYSPGGYGRGASINIYRLGDNEYRGLRITNESDGYHLSNL